MKRIGKYILLGIITATVFCFGGCSSKKSSVAAGYEKAENKVEIKPANNFDGLSNSYTAWTDVKMPVKVRLSKPISLSASGTATMVKGKSIGISVKVFGIEMASLYADEDSVYMIVKLNRIAYVESMEKFSSATGLCLADLQSIILGQAFAPGKGTITYKDANLFKISDSSDMWSFSPKKLPQGFGCIFSATGSKEGSMVPVLESLKVDMPGSRSIDCTFSGHSLTPGGMISESVDLKANVTSKPIECNLTWSMDKARWNRGISPNPPTVNPSYTRLSTTQLIKFIQNFQL